MHNKGKFEDTLNDLVQHTPAKFIIITREKFELRLGAGGGVASMPQIVLTPLADRTVVEIFKFYFETVGESLKQKQAFNDQLSELISVMPKTPKTVMETVQNITENMDIALVIKSFKSAQTAEKSNEEFTVFNLLVK